MILTITTGEFDSQMNNSGFLARALPFIDEWIEQEGPGLPLLPKYKDESVAFVTRVLHDLHGIQSGIPDRNVHEKGHLCIFNKITITINIFQRNSSTHLHC